MEVTVYPISQGESATYDSLQDAVSAFGITDPPAPSWVPERFGSPEVYVENKASGICIYADYETGEDFLCIRFNESSRAAQRTVEKDSSPDTSHIRRNITHHIVADSSLLKVTWNNGVFECHILLCVGASARSSNYLDLYGVVLTPQSGGKIVITVDVDGIRSMTQIGATTIFLYESTDGTDFTRVKTYNYEDYPTMMGFGRHFYEDVVTYDGVAGRYYYAIGYTATQAIQQAMTSSPTQRAL